MKFKMFKDVAQQNICFFLIVWATFFDYVSALCVVTDKGATQEETYQETVCYKQGVGWNQCENKLRSKTVYLGPTACQCTNSSFQEIYDFNAEMSNNTHFYITESSLNSLISNGKTWPRLTELTMENVNISQIVPGFFHGFPELSLLSIPQNNITKLVDGVFSSLINLVHLNISYNSIYNIETLSFIGLSKLNTLDLRHNKIKSLPPKVLFVQRNLSYLDLSHNLLTTYNNINALNLETIFLNNNNFTLFGFPNHTCNNASFIDISSNKLRQLENFESCKAHVVNMSFNLIQDLHRVGEITIFNISHNSLKFIRKGFISNSVATLDLAYNFISNISLDAFSDGTKLKRLCLNNNKIKELSTGIFKNQEDLEHLDLSNNNILYFEFGTFYSLGNLKYLNISYNEGIIDFQALFRISQLEDLDFENNQPQNFDQFFFETHEKLKTIRMGYNTWDCGDLAKLIHLIEKRNITLLKGRSDSSVHIHGIECNSNLKSRTQSPSDITTIKNQVQENFINNSILPHFQDLRDIFFNNSGHINIFINNNTEVSHDSKPLNDQEVRVIDKSSYSNNVNDILGNILLFFIVFMLLVLCGLLIRNRNVVRTKEQVELI